MASIENKSRTQVTVKGRADLTKHFPHNKVEAAAAYVAQLTADGPKPQMAVLDEAYLVRFKVNGVRKSFTAATEQEAIATKQRIESDQHHGLFIDYTKAHQTSLGDLLIRYLREEAPRTKGFYITACQINSWLLDAGLPVQNVAEVHANHPNPAEPHPKLPKQTGKRASKPCAAAAFIRKAFAALQPEDFQDFYDERAMSVAPATVDREHDLFKLVCTIAMKKWRIPVAQHPMDGLKAPSYYNERDRRLSPAEEARLMVAAEAEDRETSIATRMEELRASRLSSGDSPTTKYQRLQQNKELRAEAEASYVHVPLLATFIQFQLMAGPRRGETLKLTWDRIDLDGMSAYLPETKNGRARHLVVRTDLIELLRKLPRDSELVFPMTTDYLRRAWERICIAAGIPTEGENALLIHDLRHEAISRVAEAGSNTPGGFTLLDLQLFSGHRDPRMLMRYANLLPKAMAQRLDLAFEKKGMTKLHQGRKRFTKEAIALLEELLANAGEAVAPDEPSPAEHAAPPNEPVSNVVVGNFRWNGPKAKAQ